MIYHQFVEIGNRRVFSKMKKNKGATVVGRTCSACKFVITFPHPGNHLTP